MASTLDGTLVAERYLIRHQLDSGGSASIYEAEDITLGRMVAVKVPHENIGPDSIAAKRLLREARAAGAVGHPNVCEVCEIGALPNGTPFVVMERLRGETLRDRLSHRGQLPIVDIVDIMMQVLSALGAAHEQRIVHRDIKPENIFLVRRGGCLPLVKILDFGCVTTDAAPSRLSKRAGALDEDLTATGMVIGTPWYLAPEALRGVREFDGRLDLYACGIILYEATTGQRPFDAPNIAELCKSILTGAAQPVTELRPDAPPALVAVIARAMAASHTQRFASASAFQHALSKVPTGHSGADGGKVDTAEPSDVARPSQIMIDVVMDEDSDAQSDWDQPTLVTKPRGQKRQDD